MISKKKKIKPYKVCGRLVRGLTVLWTCLVNRIKVEAKNNVWQTTAVGGSSDVSAQGQAQREGVQPLQKLIWKLLFFSFKV